MKSEIKMRNSTIDIVKGLSAIIIVMTYYNIPEKLRFLPIFPFMIDLVVPVFMFISGYVFSLMHKRKNVIDFNAAYSLKIWRSRDVRYTIPYLVIAVIEIVSPRVSISGDIILDGVKWLVNGTVGYGSYYYPMMIQFLFTFPLIYFLVRNRRSGGITLA